ncbi:MAG: hypothetical protein ACLS43_01820 [Evtepia gabavorous]
MPWTGRAGGAGPPVPLPLGEVTLELPAGKLSPERTPGQRPAELAEETD